ncbi:hypothetical protein HMPREF9383_1523 [Streptococcus sanguinis SK150]|uniref:Uncharacterized protein n=1 Tax=Streptococcus sanguinis SK150 TaxID=888811 RepID=F0IN20_STRSA|nr:hypothetical protein HMPREF9383_1523 [Streptococcus sanguinis SK150]
MEKIKNKKRLLIQSQTFQEYDARADKDFLSYLACQGRDG